HVRMTTQLDRPVDELGLLVRSIVRESGYGVERIRAAGIASAVPPVTPNAVQLCDPHLGIEAAVIDARSPLPIRLDVEEPLSVGADRIANTLAAAYLYRTDTIAVDLGTATTFDCITGDGVFLGGVIAPGVKTGGDMLVSRTAKLLRIDLKPPTGAIGRRTETSLPSRTSYSAID